MVGSYRLLAELGHGGMADVFLAVAEGPSGSGFAKLAVVKMVRSHLTEDAEFVSMIRDEARLTARLAHPNVVQLFEVGEERGQFYLAIEYLEGQPLHRILRRGARARTPIPRELYYAVVTEMLAGLHYAHELADYDGSPLAVVHRDVTPHNVFVTYDGAVKVVDFGIAKAMGRATETRQGMIKGKYRYMSPEQAGGTELDRRTDIFAAGVILWNVATGSKLWGDDEDLVVMTRLCRGSYDPSPRAARADVPEEIDRICRRALAFRPEDRYATAAEMRADLEAFLDAPSRQKCKELGALMRDIFASERAKTRKVIERAGLSSVASLPLFTASAGADASDARAFYEEVPLEEADTEMAEAHGTRRMPGAPALPSPRVDVRKKGPTAAQAPRPAARAEPRPEPKRSLARKVLWIVALAMLLALGVRAVSGQRATTGDGVRRGSEITSDMTPIENRPREKSSGPLVEPVGPRSETPSKPVRVSPRGPTTAAAAPGGAPSPPTSGTTTTTTPIDHTDPWSAGGAGSGRPR